MCSLAVDSLCQIAVVKDTMVQALWPVIIRASLQSSSSSNQKRFLSTATAIAWIWQFKTFAMPVVSYTWPSIIRKKSSHSCDDHQSALRSPRSCLVRMILLAPNSRLYVQHDGLFALPQCAVFWRITNLVCYRHFADFQLCFSFSYLLVQSVLDFVGHENDKSSPSANGYLAQMNDFKYFFGLSLAQTIFSATEQISTLMQRIDTHLQDVLCSVDTVLGFFERMRSKFLIWLSKVVVSIYLRWFALQTVLRSSTARLVITHRRTTITSKETTTAAFLRWFCNNWCTWYHRTSLQTAVFPGDRYCCANTKKPVQTTCFSYPQSSWTLYLECR